MKKKKYFCSRFCGLMIYVDLTIRESDWESVGGTDLKRGFGKGMFFRVVILG